MKTGFMHRRQFLQILPLISKAMIVSWGATFPRVYTKTPTNTRPQPHIVVVGGGYGGAACAKYLRMWSQGNVRVTLIERHPFFVSCPMSNLVLSGDLNMSDITMSYDRLQHHWGIHVLQGDVIDADPSQQTVMLSEGTKLSYDRLVLSPGIDFISNAIPAFSERDAFNHVPHAWTASTQTRLLRQQLEAMPNGGVFAIAIPRAPYRCAPAPYERASMVAHYFKRNKPKSKVLILDANEKIQSKERVFKESWARLYPHMLEYFNESELQDVDIKNKTAILWFENVKADVLNVIPPMRAGDIVFKMGLKTINHRWAEVNWLTHESVNTPGVHVLGDALFPAAMMAKSADMANQHAKVTAAAILHLLADEPPNPHPVLQNTCYAFVNANHATHIKTAHQYDAAHQTYIPYPETKEKQLTAATQKEAEQARRWAHGMWREIWG